MNRIFVYAMFLSVTLLLSCSESSSPSKSNLTLVSGINRATVSNMAHFKNDVISSDEISIKVESVRILLSEIKVKQQLCILQK